MPATARPRSVQLASHLPKSPTTLPTNCVGTTATCVTRAASGNVTRLSTSSPRQRSNYVEFKIGASTPDGLLAHVAGHRSTKSLHLHDRLQPTLSRQPESVGILSITCCSAGDGGQWPLRRSMNSNFRPKPVCRVCLKRSDAQLRHFRVSLLRSCRS
jgi:hypothetical protein